MEYGSCVAKDVNKKQKIDLMDFGSERGELVSLYYIAEIIKGGPLSERIMEIGQQIGLFLLLMLMAFAFYNDINRLVSG